MKGKVVIVTGHKQGIGAAIFDELQRVGAIVYGFDLPEHDITQFASLTQWVNAIVDKEGRLDCLVNNAGVNALGSLLETTLTQFDEVFAVNVKAAFALMQVVIPQMIKQSAGAIVNMASDQAFAAKEYAAAYGASKAALVQLTKSTALDYAKYNIRVNALCAGSVHTPMSASIVKDLIKRYPQTFANMSQQDIEQEGPLQRFADASEIAKSVVFLLSDEASFMTGCAMPVDGGVTAQ